MDLWGAIKGIVRWLLLGAPYPTVADYFEALNDEPLRARDDDFKKVVFNKAEVRFVSRRVSVIYYESEQAETFDLFLNARRGGLVFTMKNHKVTTITKNAATTVNPKLSAQELQTLSKIAKVIREAAHQQAN